MAESIAESVTPDVTVREIPTASRIDAELRGIGRARARLLARIATLLLALKRGRHFVRLGFGSLTDYATARLDFSSRKTRDLLELAERCEGLLGIRRAFETGAVHWTKLRTIASVATAANESEWLARAAAMSSRALERAVAAASGETVPKIKLVLEVTDEQYADIEDAVRSMRHERRNETTPVSREEAILELLRRGRSGTVGSPRPRFQTVIYRCESCEAAMRETRQGEVPVEPATDGCARCDSDLVDARRPGRIAKTIPPAVRRHVLARDRGRCTIPGCSQRDYLDVHHIIPRAHGGNHDPALLASLCPSHHGAIHSGALRIEGRAPRFRILTADGVEIADRSTDAHVSTGVATESTLSPTAVRVLSEIHDGPLDLDDVIERTDLPAGAVLAAVAELDLAGLARRRGAAVALCGT